MSYRRKSVRFATRMHSAVRDRRNRNRDGARMRCNKVRRESSRSDESSAGGRSERQQRDRQQFSSLADDLSSLLSCVDLARIAFWKKAFLPRGSSTVKKIS